VRFKFAFDSAFVKIAKKNARENFTVYGNPFGFLADHVVHIVCASVCSHYLFQQHPNFYGCCFNFNSVN
jgi:hypothetical protein